MLFFYLHTPVCLHGVILLHSHNFNFTFVLRKTNKEIATELNITPVLDKIQDCKRNWIQHVNRMPRNRLPRLIKNLHPKRQKEPRKIIEKLLEAWDWNVLTSGPTLWLLHHDDLFLEERLVHQLRCMSSTYHVWSNCTVEQRWSVC
jgi:hypothetical protein